MASTNNLNKMRTYLVGAMDRVPDGGVGWREDITPHLKAMNISVINPCKPNVKIIKENQDTRRWIEYYKETGQYSKIKKTYGNIRNSDLRCVDISDFLVCCIDIDVHMCGSYEEIVTANRQKKPILIWCKQGKQNAPNWLFFMLPHEHIFSTMDELLIYLKSIDIAENKEALDRWFFFNQHEG